MKERIKGDRYRPIVTIHKLKKGVPTRIEIKGNTYVLAHKDQTKGRVHD
jgi:hypothetical protein